MAAVKPKSLMCSTFIGLFIANVLVADCLKSDFFEIDPSRLPVSLQDKAIQKLQEVENEGQQELLSINSKSLLPNEILDQIAVEQTQEYVASHIQQNLP